MTILDPTITVPDFAPLPDSTLRFSISFDRDCRILDAASKQEGRYAMHGVLLELSGGVPTADHPEVPAIEARLVATDGRILSVILVDIETEDDAPINPIMLDRQYILPPEIVKAATVKSRANGRPARITIDATDETDGGPIIETEHPDLGTIKGRTIVGEFPRWKAVVPDESKANTRIAFNPAHLLALAKSLGSPDSVRIEIDTSPGRLHAPILVRGNSGQTGALALDAIEPEDVDRTGVLMPITLDV